jgi:hypothetical protein
MGYSRFYGVPACSVGRTSGKQSRLEMAIMSCFTTMISIICTVVALQCCVVSGHRLHTTDIIVTNAESGEPIDAVPVEVFYNSLTVNSPSPVCGITDANGKVRLPVADLTNGGISIRAGGDKLSELRQFHVTPDQVRNGGLPIELLGDLPVCVELRPGT